MTEAHSPLQILRSWPSIVSHATRLGQSSLSALFAADPLRFERLSRRADGLLLDFSKQSIDPAALADLLVLAQEARLTEGIAALFGGEQVNFTEGRAALHMALRGSCPPPAADRDRLAEASTRLRAFASALRRGEIKGATGETIRTVINLGIGGSDLGPRMAVEALAGQSIAPPLAVRFVANIDPQELKEALAGAEPASTLFIVSSKSFSTAETLANATSARAWLSAELGGDTAFGPHFAAVSNATEAAAAFGIDPERVFPLPDWVGGRYSVWSAIGLPLLIAIGEAAFDEFLAGGRTMDLHFRDSAAGDNLPVLLGLVDLWNASVLGCDTVAVLPYAHGLRNFPAWLQQLEMESNGKHRLRDGSSSALPTAPVVWGGVGTVGQHAFHQLFYQGTRRVPMDFIVPVGSDDPRQQALVDNALAQSAALMNGRDLATAEQSLRAAGLPDEEVARLAPHLVCPGDRPSTTLLMPALTPFTLGQLLALFEHKVFVQGWLLGINSFDQYGVELGKEMARKLAEGGSAPPDPSTAALIAAVAAMRRG